MGRCEWAQSARQTQRCQSNRKLPPRNAGHGFSCERKHNTLGVLCRPLDVAKWRPIKGRLYCEAGGLSGSMPIRSLTAKRNFCLQPRYRSVVWIETCPSRNWIWSNSPQARWQSRAQLRRLCRMRHSAEDHAARVFSIPARFAAARTTSQSTLGVMPVPQTRPVLLIDRKSEPSVMPPASFHSSIAPSPMMGLGRYGCAQLCPGGRR